MTHPLFHSRAGRILYRELPEAMRLYDTRDPGTGALGDLEAYLFGFGHLLDRFDASLRQFHADGLLDPVGPAGDERDVQGWLLPYIAQLFGVDLTAPDPESRRRELSASIWVARRRGTRVAVDTAAEMLVGTPVVVVAGAARVLRCADMRQPPMTHREITGFWHPADAMILAEPLPPPSPATHVSGMVDSLPRHHDGLRIGTPDARVGMRAVAGGIARPDAEVRPVSGLADASDLAAFHIHKRRGRPCFPDSYEDRSLRTPDMRSPARNRPRFTHLKMPDATALFVRPPSGMFTGAETPASQPGVSNGQLSGNGIPDGGQQSDVFYTNAGFTRALSAANADASGRHVIRGLKFAGTIEVKHGRDVTFIDCAIGGLTSPAAAPGADTVIRATGCIFGSVDTTGFSPASETQLEYCTITGASAFGILKASDCIFADTLISDGDGVSDKPGCIRYSLVPEGFDRTHVHMFQSHFGTAPFLRWPCITRGGTTLPSALPIIGEPGFAVLSDLAPRAIAQGAEDGGEMGAYHGQWHLARLAAAGVKARGYLPAGQKVFAHYDPRLLAHLPTRPD